MFRVFYSWMSDHGSENRQLIFRALTNALGRVCSREDINIPRKERAIIQCGDFGNPGDIWKFIGDNLPSCHAHVVDLTFINHQSEPITRRTPNPNNMLELGMTLGMESGAIRAIPVFNTDHGGAEDLPFDVRNRYTVKFNGSAPNALGTLKNDLASALEQPARQYVQLRDGLMCGTRRCLDVPRTYISRFLESHAPSQALAEISIAMFEPTATLLPSPDVLRDLLRSFNRNALSENTTPRECDGFRWVDVFAMLLRRLQADCRRLCHRYSGLRHATLYGHLQDLALEAEHLENLLDRVSDRLEDRLLDDLIVEEIESFLKLFLKVHRINQQLPPQMATPENEAQLLEPVLPAGAPQIQR